MLVLSENAARKPKHWFWISSLASLLLIALVLVPTLAPQKFAFLHGVHIDTDPENMLSPDEPVRVYHNQMKAEFNLHDIVVVGIVNNQHPQGVFNTKTLTAIHELTGFARDLQWQEAGDATEKPHGVIRADIIAPSVVDNIEQAGPGTVRFDWLMQSPPATDEEAAAIAAKAARIPFLNGTMISEDAKALALYVPIASKADSYEVAEALRAKIAGLDSADEWHITGLPVAQDQFGVEMFIQMAISAPMAMVLIFALMWYFFRNLKLVIAPMIVAMISVIMTMTLLVATGNTVHIMSSMIPIFIMPIAVLDAVHILSDFFDRYPSIKDRGKTVRLVMEELWKPMLFTTLTTCAGFASLAFTPIPPVQVFGVFVSLGVFFAWIFTITLVPAYIMLMKEESLDGFGHKDSVDGADKTLLSRFLGATGRSTFGGAKLVLIATLALGGFAWMGIQRIEINDNPVKWFEPDHDIRVADRALNERFAGTYMAYLSLEAPADQALALSEQDLTGLEPAIAQSLLKAQSDGADLPALVDLVLVAQDAADSDDAWDNWDLALQLVEQKIQSAEVFKDPAILRWTADLQAHLQSTGLVGKSNSLGDIVKTVHRDLFEGREEAFRIPDSAAAVAQTLITYQSSHRPQDLWHFVTPDYRKSNLWIQLKSGDNKDMNKVVAAVDQWVAANPAPAGVEHNWFGLTYINTVWQQKMVSGMMDAFLGSFVIVLVMMTFLFRSLWWGILSMIPLTVSIGLIYGVIGWIGKDYDMPVAVLSALSLGLAVDYAIHFLARSREMQRRYGSWKETLPHVFGEPARAIFRNVIVIGVGFLPLLLAPLVPYQTVGVFISAILLSAGAASLLILPALIRLGEKLLFKQPAAMSGKEASAKS